MLRASRSFLDGGPHQQNRHSPERGTRPVLMLVKARAARRRGRHLNDDKSPSRGAPGSIRACRPTMASRPRQEDKSAPYANARLPVRLLRAMQPQMHDRQASKLVDKKTGL